MGENSMYSEHLRNVDIKYANLIKGCLEYVLEVKKNPKSGKATRVRIEHEGKNVKRIAKKSGEEIK